MLGIASALLIAVTETPLEGRWTNPARSVILRIAPCEGNALCGTVEWASDKAKADARRGTDALVGSQLLTGLRPTGEERWTGRVFIPDANRRLRAKIELRSGDSLKVSGCAVGGALCKSQIWTRVASDSRATVHPPAS